MIQTKLVVREIMDILSSDRALDLDRLAKLASEFEAACNLFIARISRCRDLLDQGATARASSLAKEQPSLYSEMEHLNFKRLDDWLTMCRELDLPYPDNIDFDSALEVFRRIKQIPESAVQLMKTLKLMSLGNAPLKERLAVARKLAAVDHVNDFWREDVKRFEAARLAEIMKEAARSSEAEDLETLEELLGELRDIKWSMPVDNSAKEIEKTAIPLRRKQAFARYRMLAGELREAHALLDEEKCRRLLKKWDKVKKDTGFAPADAIAGEIAPVAEWLDELESQRKEEGEYQKSCAELESALDEITDIGALDRLASNVLSFERGMPKILSARYASRRAELESSRRRAFALKLASILLGAALVAGAAGFLIYRYILAGESARWTNQIQGALDKDDLESARKRLDALAAKNPRIFRSAGMQELALAVSEAERNDSARRGQFHSAIEALRVTVEEGNPDMKLLEKAGELAARADERHLLQDLREKAAALQKRAAQAREAEIDELLAELRRKVDRLSAMEQADATAEGELRSAAEECLDLALKVSLTGGKNSVQEARLAMLRQQADRVINDLNRRREERRELEDRFRRFREGIADAAELKLAMEDFIREKPDHRLAPAYILAVRAAPDWQALQEWRHIRKDWPGIRVDGAGAASQRLPHARDFAEKHGESLYGEHIRNYLRYLEYASGAFENGRLKNTERLGGILSDPIYSNLFLVQAGEKRYYAIGREVENSGVSELILPGAQEVKTAGETTGYSIDTLVDVRGDSVRRRTFHVREIKSGPAVAPHCVFARRALERLRNFRGNGWETLFLDMAAEMQQNEEIDPILRLMLIYRLLQFASETTPFLSNEIEKIADEKLRVHFAPLNWVGPDDNEANNARARIVKALAEVESLAGLSGGVLRRLEEMENGLAAYRPVGIALDGSQVFVADNAPSGAAYAIAYLDGAASMVNVGRINGGGFRREGGTGLPPGCLIYIKE